MPSFDYSVRISGRARQPRIVVRPNLTVEVVLPRGVGREHAQRFVLQKREWVERSLQRFAAAAGDGVHEPFPDSVALPAAGLNFNVTYRETDSGYIRVNESGHELHISGPVESREMVAEGLRRWLRRKAKTLLLPMLVELAGKYGFRCGKVTIRLQKSRWGSCTGSGNISLNAKLLFLEPHLARYVILHELAHLEHMNHSPGFWAVVARCDTDYLHHRKRMCSVSTSVPRWAEG